MVYLNDILIFSRSIGEHWDYLKIALDRLLRAKLYGRLHKCEFIKDKVDYLGFEVSKDGIRASPEKVKAVLDWPRPHLCTISDHFGDWLATTENLLKDSRSWRSR